MAVVSALRALLWEARSAGVEAHASQVVSISTMADEVFDVETRLHCARVAQKIVRHQIMLAARVFGGWRAAVLASKAARAAEERMEEAEAEAEAATKEAAAVRAWAAEAKVRAEAELRAEQDARLETAESLAELRAAAPVEAAAMASAAAEAAREGMRSEVKAEREARLASAAQFCSHAVRASGGNKREK